MRYPFVSVVLFPSPTRKVTMNTANWLLIPFPSSRETRDAVCDLSAHCRDRFVDAGHGGIVEYPEGSGQYLWLRYDEEGAQEAGYCNYGDDGALDSYFTCGLAVPIDRSKVRISRHHWAE